MKATTIKTIKDLNKTLVKKQAGREYEYYVNNTKFTINEFNNNKGWALNEYYECGQLKYSYGHNGLLLKDCKEMILDSWNKGEIK